MSVPKLVFEFLDREGDRFCDDCITDELKLKRRQQAQHVTSVLEVTPLFSRHHDECVRCGATKLIIVRLPAKEVKL